MAKKREKIFSDAIDRSKISGLNELVGPPPSQDETKEEPKQEKSKKHPEQTRDPKTPDKAPVKDTGAPEPKEEEPRQERVYRTSLNIKYSEEQRNKLWIIRSALNKTIGELAMDAIGEYIERFEEEHGEIILPEILTPRD